MIDFLSNWGIDDIAELESHKFANLIFVDSHGERYVLQNVNSPAQIINDGAKVSNYLYEVGINVPHIIRANDGNYFVKHDQGDYIILQTFVEGVQTISSDVFVKNLFGFTQLFGVLHRTLYESGKKFWKGMRPGFLDPDKLLLSLKNLDTRWLKLPENEYVVRQHEVWVKEYDSLPWKKLTKGVIHGNIGPGVNILHDGGNITGFVNFFNAHFTYYLYELATFMEYANMFAKEVEPLVKQFLLTYLDTAPVGRKEIKYLKFFLKSKFLMQILHFTYKSEDTGDDTIDFIKVGINSLKKMDELPSDYYYGLIEGSYSII